MVVLGAPQVSRYLTLAARNLLIISTRLGYDKHSLQLLLTVVHARVRNGRAQIKGSLPRSWHSSSEVIRQLAEVRHERALLEQLEREVLAARALATLQNATASHLLEVTLEVQSLHHILRHGLPVVLGYLLHAFLYPVLMHL